MHIYCGEYQSRSELCTQPRYLIATPRPFHSPLKIGSSVTVCVAMYVLIDSWILQEMVPVSSGVIYKIKLVHRTYFVAVCGTLAHALLDRLTLQLDIWDFLIRVIKSRRMRLAGHMAYMRDKRNTYVVLLRKAEGKRPRGRTRQRRQDYMGLEGTRWDDVEWIYLPLSGEKIGRL